MSEILFLQPCMKDTVWGGRRLREDYGYEAAGDSTGECWGISAHPKGDCTVREGIYQGVRLSELYDSHRELFGNCQAEQFPLLIKIIDAKDDLSIQVHPDDGYARKEEGYPFGKMECWYIMDCPEGASLIYGNHARNREELKQWIAAGEYEKLICRVPVKRGDFVQIDPGTVHAITKGLLVLETAQNSDIIYRVYDYNRKTNGKARPLHVRQSMECIKVPDSGERKRVVHTQSALPNKMFMLEENAIYRVGKLTVQGEAAVDPGWSFMLGSVMSGDGSLNGRALCKGDHFILTAGYERAVFGGNMELILSSAGE